MHSFWEFALVDCHQSKRILSLYMNTRHDVRIITTANCVRHTCFKFRNFHLICWSRSSWICCICCTACFHVFESRSGFFSAHEHKTSKSFPPTNCIAYLLWYTNCSVSPNQFYSFWKGLLKRFVRKQLEDWVICECNLSLYWELVRLESVLRDLRDLWDRKLT